MLMLKAVVDAINAEVDRALVTLWTCRHCGHLSPIITEICDGCGVEDCHQGAGEESARDERLRLSGQRGSIGIWTPERIAGMVSGLVKE